MNPVRTLETTFCDDVRQEIGNKVTIVGCYMADMIVEQFPIVIPKLCAHVRIISARDNPLSSLTVRLKRNADVLGEISATQETVGRQDQPMYADATAYVITTVLCASPLVIEAPCKVTVEAVLDGESICSLPLRVHTRETAAKAMEKHKLSS